MTLIGDGPCKTRWHEKAQLLGLADRVTWRPSVPRNEFLQQLSAYDVLLFPSLHDSGGMVVLEAMNAGLPVVCLDFGGPAVLVDETCGFKVKASTPDAAVEGLHAGLHALIEDRSLGIALGKAGHRRALDLFSWRGRVQRMLRCYEEVLCRA